MNRSGIQTTCHPSGSPIGVGDDDAWRVYSVKKHTLFECNDLHVAHARTRGWDDAGFSLTELMVVVVIVGILAMLAIPRFLNVTTEAKMTEAKMMLRQVQTLQQAYRYGSDTYSADLAAIGFQQVALQPDGGTARYRIAIEQADAAGFVATATSVVDFDQDGVFNVWEASASGEIRQRTPD